jgi:hypothetical protein
MREGSIILLVLVIFFQTKMGENAYDPQQDMHERRELRRAYRDRIHYTDGACV